MRALRRLFGKEEKPQLEGVEVVQMSTRTEIPIEPIYVKRFDLNSISDVQVISEELRRGNILIIKITPLLNKDPEELKEAIEQLKGICSAIGGDLGRLDEEKIIATPQHILIQSK